MRRFATWLGVVSVACMLPLFATIAGCASGAKAADARPASTSPPRIEWYVCSENSSHDLPVAMDGTKPLWHIYRAAEPVITQESILGTEFMTDDLGHLMLVAQIDDKGQAALKSAWAARPGRVQLLTLVNGKMQQTPVSINSIPMPRLPIWQGAADTPEVRAQMQALAMQLPNPPVAAQK